MSNAKARHRRRRRTVAKLQRMLDNLPSYRQERVWLHTKGLRDAVTQAFWEHLHIRGGGQPSHNPLAVWL